MRSGGRPAGWGSASGVGRPVADAGLSVFGVGSGSATRCCVRPSIGWRRFRTGSQVHAALAEVTDREPIRTAAPGIGPRPYSGRTRRSRRSLSARRARAQARGGLAAAGAFLERSVLLSRSIRPVAPSDAGRGVGRPPGRRVRQGSRTLVTAAAGPLDDFPAPASTCCAGRSRSPRNLGSDAPPDAKAAKRLESFNSIRRVRPIWRVDGAALFAGRLAGVGDFWQAPAPQGPPAAHPCGRSTWCSTALRCSLPTAWRPRHRRCGQPRASLPVGTSPSTRGSGGAGSRRRPPPQSGTRTYGRRSYGSARSKLAARDVGALTSCRWTWARRPWPSRGAVTFRRRLLGSGDSTRSAPRRGRTRPSPRRCSPLCGATGAEVTALIEVHHRRGRHRGQGVIVLTDAHWATAILCNSLGRYAGALPRRRQATRTRRRFCVPSAVPD